MPLVYDPKINLEKYVSVDGTNFVDADYVLGAPLPYGPQNVNVNAPVDFRITVENKGNVSLTNVVITDNNTSNGGNSTVTLYQNGALTAAALAFGATLVGDDNDGITGNVLTPDGILQVGETWTIEYTTAFDPGQHLNTGYVTTAQGALDNDNAAYYSLVNEGPGVRTPGFWSNLGAQFWNNIANDETKSGPNFAEGELIYAVDSNNDGFINSVAGDGINDDKAVDKVGLLIGDFNQDGFTGDNPNTMVIEGSEDTLFIGLSDAKNLINASQKTVSGDGVQMLGRDVVATWLNYLAGNNVGTDSGDTDHSPKHFISDAVDWLQTFGDSNASNTYLAGETFDTYAPTGSGGHAAVKTSSAFWNQPRITGDPHTASQMHSSLDQYNNDGTIGGTTYAHDADDAAFTAAIAALQSSVGSGSGGGAEDSSLYASQHMIII